MNIVKPLYIALISITSLILSCKGPEKATIAKGGQTTSLSEDQRMQLTYKFVTANKEKILGNEGRAMELFAECLRIDPRNDASLYEMALLLSNKKKYAEAINFVKTAVSINPKNEWYKQLLAELYQRTSKWNDAVGIYEQLVKDNPTKIEYYYLWAQVLMFAERFNDAIKVYDKIETETGIDADNTIRKERLYLKLGKTEKAAEELEKYIAKNPGSMEMYSLLYELYAVNNMPEKALLVIERMKSVNPNEPRIYLNLADYYRTQGNKEKSFENLKIAFTNKELDTDIKVKIISSYLPLLQRDSMMMEQCLQLCKTLAETHPNEARAQAIYGDLLTMNKEYGKSVIFYQNSLNQDKNNLNVWQQYIINQSELKDFNAMDSGSTEAITLFPNESSLYLLNGIAKSQRNQPEAAIAVLLQGLKFVVDNDEQLIQFYSNLGDCYHKIKNYTESDNSFENALKLNPKEVYVLNNYAYYLSLRMDKLEKAEQMSKLSNDLQPNQSSFLDTYGWILYQEKKYDEAKKWLEKALENGGASSGTILEHYGDVLFKLNDTEKAIDNWNKAKQAGGATELIDKKIRDKKLYE